MNQPQELRLIELGSFNRLAKAKHGWMVYNRFDSYIGKSIEMLGEWSEGEADLFRQAVRPGAIVVEVGSNIGTLTLPLAKLAGPQGVVLAFEPQRIVFQTFCANLALNGIQNVVAHWAALGAAEGSLIVPPLDYQKTNNFGGLALGGYERGESVPVHTLDRFQLGRLDFLKADVEGMELDVLKGATKTLERCKPILYLENDRKEKEAELLTFIKNLGYRIFAHVPMMFNPNNHYGCTENPFRNIVSRNILCIPPQMQANIQGLAEL